MNIKNYNQKTIVNIFFILQQYLRKFEIKSSSSKSMKESFWILLQLLHILIICYHNMFIKGISEIII